MIWFLSLTGAVCCIYLVLNFKYDLQMLQQNSYRIDRYWHWLDKQMTTTQRLVDVALLFLLFTTLIPTAAAILMVAVVCAIKIVLILRRKYKKPLVFTNRVRRIYSVATAISLIFICAFAAITAGAGNFTQAGRYIQVLPFATLLLICIFSWAFVIAAVWLLKPVESHINKRYYNEASQILQSIPGLTVVGITGSYGKTTTKHYLERILSEKYNVLMTPGSYNTPMGVIRTVREMMKPYHEVFICEMGAKQSGDIKEICDLVHPRMGIITAVGPMHLESFKTIENIQKTKFELADALPADGCIAVNNDFEMCASREVGNVKTIRYTASDNEHASFKTTNISYSPAGTEFVLEGPDGFKEKFTTPLVGECNISNLTGAIIIALELGVGVDKIKYALTRMEQVEHRLNVKRTPGGVAIIDDAFNSNPSGSKMALDVLKSFTSGKRIIVTPGMIELGARQFELNKELGTYMNTRCDIAVIVGHYNRESLLSGAIEGGMKEEDVILVDSFAEAQKYLSGVLKPGDTVLYENDLPDTFK